MTNTSKKQVTGSGGKHGGNWGGVRGKFEVPLLKMSDRFIVILVFIHSL